MTEKIESRQQQILKLLLENKAGLSIDELSVALSISRNAVQQHLAVLEKEGCIQIGILNKTAGRPVRSFVLTKTGINSFPKQYAWFSELILSDLKKEMGSEALQSYLHKLAVNLSQTLLPHFEGKQTEERIGELIKVMDGLGFKTRNNSNSDTHQAVIEACNCIYHDLAQKHEEICEFDRVLISCLLDKKIEQTECMAKGGAMCCFKIINE
jgi:predicted ArsR family transcriptional regulator